MVDQVKVPAEEGLKDPTNKPPVADNTDAPKVPEKFLGEDGQPDVNKLVQSYTELEKRLGKSSSEKTPEADGDKQKTDGEAPNKEAPKEAPKSVEEAKQFLPGFEEQEIQEISDYAWQNQSLTDEHYEKLEKAGYSRDIVDQFMAGQFAMAEASQAQLLNAGGGAEQVQAMFEWAADSMDQKEVDRYNSLFDKGGADALMAMENLKAKYEASGEGIGGSFVRGANAPRGDGSVFRSAAQVTEAIKDPRYATDPAYRKEVEQKIARSKVL